MKRLFVLACVWAIPVFADAGSLYQNSALPPLPDAATNNAVAAGGAEVSTPWVHSFDPVTRTFERRADMPVPVDDAVAVSYGNRYVYLISGWHDLGNVNLVQRYDSQSDSWSQATPTPGSGVFGHAGASSATTSFTATALPSTFTTTVAGSDNPYNFSGVGYNGEPSEPLPGAVLFSFDEREWRTYEVLGTSTMDHRGLVPFAGEWLTVGGMLSGQQVARDVFGYRFSR